MKDVTIIIPSYVTTEERLIWLFEAIDSCLTQDCQIVIYDDGSPIDVISKVMHKYNFDSRIYLCGEKENHGVSYARNRAVEKVQTSLFIPLDCDDKFAEGTIDKLLSVWKGVPIYSDVSKFGTELVIHYRLLDFDCGMLRQKLGIAPVNVLQSVEQWKAVGKWNENIDLYEDAEYNARLLGTFCGQNYHEPLVMYRQHGTQRTRQHPDVSPNIRQSILELVRRYEHMCQSCGGARRSQMAKNSAFSTNFQTDRPLQSRLADMPGSQGEAVLAHYIGGVGQGKHYYKGPVTHFPYKVMFDDLLYVDPRDTCDPEAIRKTSFLVRVNKQEETPVEIVPAAPVPEPTDAERVPVAKIERHPVVDVDSVEQAAQDFEEELTKHRTVEIVAESSEDEEDVVDLPDISKMSIKEIRKLDLDSGTASELLKMEEETMNRDNVIEYLEGLL